MEGLVGQQVKGYELRERIGAGGFGAVYRAYQSTVGREVAVKIILPGFTNHPDFIRRFETEAQIVARLEHLHIAPLYDYWRDPGGAYLVMRYLRGGSLRRALQQGPYGLEDAATLLDQVTSALTVAHSHDVVHRDIKPENILLDEDGNAYLADFGIAKEFGIHTTALTEEHAIVGSPDYLAPEQARSEPVTVKTDIYSLGIVLYEMLTGEHPFPDLSPVERLFKHINDPVPEVEGLDADVSTAINQVVQVATAKDPAQRHADARALAAAFREAAGLSPTQSARQLVELLTPREQEVLKLIVDGKTNREIAEELVIELGTVKWYVTRIYKKLNVRSRVQAIVRARELDLIVDGQVQTTTAGIVPDLPEPENPYKGLKAFQIADERRFYGRERLTAKIIERLAEDSHHARFLAIVGPSGSGKSSLVRAGLIPALWRGALPGSEKWFIADMLPGSHPLEELEVALLKVASEHPPNLMEQLQRGGRGLHRAAQLILPDDGSELLLVIDQFEELFTLVEEEDQRAHLLDLIVGAVSEPRSRVRVIVTLRADFYDRPLQYPAFGALVQNRIETVLPLSAEELEQATARPAEDVGVQFEQGLVATIVEDVHYQPGGLPLMQYALTELFDARVDRRLTHAAYQEMGGSTGALAKRADDIYREFEEAGRTAIRQMFLRLVTLGDGGEDTRRRVPRSELLAVGDDPDLVEELIDLWTASRLLSADIDHATRSPTVELAHEAILNEWPRLREWLDDSREDIRLQRALARAAGEWRQADQDPSFLLRGTRLGQFENWHQRSSMALTAREKEFLEASVVAGHAEQQEKQAQIERELAAAQTIRRRAVYLAGALVAALGLAVAAVSFARRATKNAELAERNLQAAEIANTQLAQEADIRATAESDALEQRAQAEAQAVLAEQNAALARSRELAASAINVLDNDPALSKLLALAAVEIADPPIDSVSALHRAFQADRVVARYAWPQEIASPYSLWTHLHPSGERLVASGARGIPSPHLEVVDIASGEVLWTWDLEYANAAIDRPRFSKDGSLVITGVLWEGGIEESVANPVDQLGVFAFDAETGEVRSHIPLGQCGGTVQAISRSHLLVRTIPEEFPGGCFFPENAGDLRLELVELDSGSRELLTASARRGSGTCCAVGFGIDGGAAFSGDGRLAAFDDLAIGKVVVVDVTTGDRIFELDLTGLDQQTSFVRRLSEDGSFLVYGHRPIHIVEVASGEIIGILDTSPGAEEWVELVGDTVLVAAPDATLSGHDIHSGNRLFALPGIGNGAVSATDGGPVLVSNGTDGAVLVETGPRGELGAVETCPRFTWSWSLTATSDLATFLQMCDGSNVASTTQAIDLTSFELAYALPGGVGQQQPISPDGTRFVRQAFEGTLGVDGTFGPLVVHDLRTGERLLELQEACEWHSFDVTDPCVGREEPPLAVWAERVRWSPDGSMIGASGAAGYLMVWSADTGELLFWEAEVPSLGSTLDHHIDLVFTPDSTALVTSYLGDVVRRFSTDTWELEVEAPLPAEVSGQGGLHFIDYAEGGTALIAVTRGDAGAGAGALHWLKSDSLQLLFSIGNLHEAGLTSEAISRDGAMLATGSTNGIIRVWDAASGHLVHEVPLGDTRISGLAFIDDTHLAVTPTNGSLFVVTVDTDELIELVRSSLTRGFTEFECEKYNFGDDCPTVAELREGG